MMIPTLPILLRITQRYLTFHLTQQPMKNDVWLKTWRLILPAFQGFITTDTIITSRVKNCPIKKTIDEFALLFYYRLNTGKEVIKKYMSSNHSEVAET